MQSCTHISRVDRSVRAVLTQQLQDKDCMSAMGSHTVTISCTSFQNWSLLIWAAVTCALAVKSGLVPELVPGHTGMPATLFRAGLPSNKLTKHLQKAANCVCTMASKACPICRHRQVLVHIQEWANEHEAGSRVNPVWAQRLQGLKVDGIAVRRY